MSEVRWHHGDRLWATSIAAAAAFLPIVGWLVARESRLAAMFVIVSGVGLNVVFGRLWRRFPAVVGGTQTARPSAWAAVALWQTGVVLSALAWSEFIAAPAGILGGFILLTSIFLLVEGYARAMIRSMRQDSALFKHSFALLVPAGICLGAASLFLAISFRPGTFLPTRDIALSLFVFGGLFPAGLAALALPEPAAVAADVRAEPAG